MTRDELLTAAKIAKLFKEARAKMAPGWAYTLDQLVEADKLTDGEVEALMERFDNHPLLRRDSSYPHRWSLR